MIGIAYFLLSYYPEKYGLLAPLTGWERDFERINTIWWLNRSSDIVALFENEGDAMKCFAQSDRKRRDARWLDLTKKVLAAIGDEHPSFFVTHSTSLGLLESQRESV